MNVKETELWKYVSLKKRQLISRIDPVYATKRLFRYGFFRELDLNNPKTLNEKIQYLKLNDYYNNPIITQCVDKYRVRDFLNDVGLGYLLPKLYGCYKSVSEIDFDKLPQSFVLKCNHGCGYNVLCGNKDELNIHETRHLLKKWLKEDFWTDYCELQYKNVEKRIIAEEYLGDDIKTYKFYCFNSDPKVFYVSGNGENGEKDLYLDYYDMDCHYIDVRLGEHLSAPNARELIKPVHFEEMKVLAKKLSEKFPFVRVDLYDTDKNVYFSELTFVPTGGYMHLKPEGTDEEWGNWLAI